MLQSIVLGLMDSVSPCALAILLFLFGFLLLTALRKDIIKNAISFILALFLILFVFYGGLIGQNLISLGVLGLIGKILTLILGAYGIISFFYEKEIFSKISKYILSFPVSILFAVLLFVHFFLCSAGMVMVAIIAMVPIARGIGHLFGFLFGFIIPLIVISLVAYTLGAENEEAMDRIRFLKLIGGIILVLTIFVL